MVDERRVLRRENQGLADYVLKKKREEHAARPNGLSENMERTFVKAYRNVCDAKVSVDSLEELSQIKGFGKLMLKLMQGYFVTGAASSQQEDLSGKKAKGTERYIPGRNTTTYALLITLHRETENGKKFMRKQELIDAAEASGLAHEPIAPVKGKGKAGRGDSKREWYSGWSSMTTLIQKGLVVKFSNPAKYILTDEGRDVANECIMRSQLSNSVDILSDEEVDPAQQARRTPNQNPTFTLQEEQQYVDARSSRAQACQVDLEGSPAKKFRSCNVGSTLNPMKASSSSLASNGTKGVTTIPRLPPLKFGEAFEEAYDVILILDDREQFATRGSRSIVDNICSVFKIKIEVRRLPVGDCIWIARHKYQHDEYVLDYIVERKSIDDMRSSIMDNRYRDQKLRLQRSGIKKLMYILEGDPNQSKAAESIKTACLTTEILEGFDVLRTNGLGETLRKYGYLTKLIFQYYKSRVNDDDQSKVPASCPSFDDFVKRCQDLDKMTISDVFGIQLMQVLIESCKALFKILYENSQECFLLQIPQVTEEIAIAVLDTYPTLLSLVSAYSKLDGNVSAQEEMLRNQSNNVICASASKNIYKLVWGG
ncbi:crossover junction endonuclease MUS81 isoform X2 [Capsella rubella]|uniref:crossover junction endonuclease MUS81 isoform X2 n=1 Tax=Capsella rubella TaxID=81985 RepID=UPI000CD4F76A|nr:crossover junction endonuclease MUS81 isoform X2 [Capsella rubella]